jgi:hypothetical protein
MIAIRRMIPQYPIAEIVATIKLERTEMIFAIMR